MSECMMEHHAHGNVVALASLLTCLSPLVAEVGRAEDAARLRAHRAERGPKS